MMEFEITLAGGDLNIISADMLVRIRAFKKPQGWHNFTRDTSGDRAISLGNSIILGEKSAGGYIMKHSGDGFIKIKLAAGEVNNITLAINALL